MLLNLILVFSYGAFAAALGLILPPIADIAPATAWTAGGVLFVACALAHESWRRQEADARIAGRLARLSRGKVAVDGDIHSLRGEIAALRAQVESYGERPPALAEYDAVVEDVRVLQSLVEQLSGHRAHRPSRARAPEPVLTAERPSAKPAAPPRPLGDNELLDHVREALSADRIDVLLQPIVSLPQRKLRFYEVFSRIRAGADGDHLSAEQYIPLAEREGLVATIDNMLLFRCVQLIRETERRNHNVSFFVNISAHTLSDAPFMRQFVQFMAQNPDLTPKIVFELTQADLEAGGPMGGRILAALGQVGFRFSMDQVRNFDFDPDELDRLNIRFVKLDANRMLAEINGGPSQGLALGLKDRLDQRAIDLIVEKIETEQQLVELLDLHLDFGQGYLFGEPRINRRAG